MASVDLSAHDPNVTNLHDHDENNDVGLGNDAMRGNKRARIAEDDDDDDEKNGKERRKIDIKFITDKSRRHITFSKRKAGIMKKAYELSVLTGTQVLLLVVSETGLVYTFTTPKLQPLVTKSEGKNLIQACLNAPEPQTASENGIDGDNGVESPEEAAQAQVHGRGIPAPMPTGYAPQMTPEQAMQYQYLRGQPQGAQYQMPPGSHMPQSHPQ